MAKRFSSAPISLKTASTETGSVAEIKDPNANDSFQVKVGQKDVWPKHQNNTELKMIDINVPAKLNNKMVPIFLKKGLFLMLYPDSKMIGGSKMIRKMFEKY